MVKLEYMQKGSNMNKLTLLLFFTIFIFANSAYPQRVRIGAGPVPKGCQFRGNVSIVTQDINGGRHSSIEASQQMNLKKQAAKLGANIVVINYHKSAFYPEYFTELGEFRNELEGDALSGKAYRCQMR